MTKWTVVKLAAVALWTTFGCGGASGPAHDPPTARVDVAEHDEAGTLEVAEPSARAQPTSIELPVEDDDQVIGAADAPVTIVEFEDLECPFCQRVQVNLAELRRRYGPENLRFVFKHNPLPFHEQALSAAHFAQAVRLAAGSEASQRFVALAFAHRTELGGDAFLDWVRQIGLEPAQVAALADSDDVRARVQRDMDLAKKVGATGTPSFFVNGIKISGAQPLEKFVAIIDAELAKARGLVGAGTPPGDVYAARVRTNWHAPEAVAARTPEPPDLTTWKVPVAGAPARGPASALVTIVAFYSYQCPFSKRVQETLDQLFERYPDDLRLVVRHNPLPSHARSAPAANVAIETRAQRGDAMFFQMERRIFAAQPDLSDDQLLAAARELGLNVPRIQRALGKSAHQKAIDADVDLAVDFAARGTPHFFINGVRLSGAQPLDKFVEAVERERRRALELVERGVPRTKVYATLMKDAKSPSGPEVKLVKIPPNAISRGPGGAPVVIQVFADFQCPFCRRVQKTIEELDRAHPRQIRWVFRHLPLPHHKDARPAARAALEAHRQRGNKGFWAMHDALFEAQDQEGGLNEEALLALGAKQGLDVERLRAALNDSLHDAVIEADLDAARAAGINGTPGFVINGYYLSGAQSASAFERIIRYSRQHPAKAQPAAQATP